jgi:excisionase family DNA binding protein
LGAGRRSEQLFCFHRRVQPFRHYEEVQGRRFEATAMFDHAQFGPPNAAISPAEVQSSRTELPLTVRDAARFLGVSTQTVYLWVERKRIPHLRVMGRNIRFLKSDLLPFRATFRQEVENAETE